MKAHRYIMAGLLLAPALAWSQSITFLQMSDPQFGMYTENHGFAQETANFEFAIATANRLRPTFVLITGDLVNKGGDAAQIAEFWRIAHKLDKGIGLYVAPGNHDVGNTPTAESLAVFRRNFGKDYYTFEYPGFEGIVLDSSLIQHPDQAPEEAAKQEKWLEEQLAKSSGTHQVVVFQHIPFFLHTADEADGYFNIPSAVRGKYLDLLSHSPVHYIFAGHLHHNSEGEDGALHMISTGPVGKPLGDGASGMRIVKIDGSAIEQRYADFGHLPNQLDDAFAKK